MRLTLRTLLAYLDDTLEPSQAKLIGEKVAESEHARELIARIKQVARRRRLTTPADSGPAGKLDENTIAEYLDNVLPAGQVGELEETCLSSDVHLAEVAACHQILTLILGEPMLIPPTATQRMYRLIKGKEAIPDRKAPAPPAESQGAPRLVPEADGADEPVFLGFPLSNQHSNRRWVVPVLAVSLLLAAFVAIWMAVESHRAIPAVAMPATSVANLEPATGEEPPKPAVPPVDATQPREDARQPEPKSRPDGETAKKPASGIQEMPANPPPGKSAPKKGPSNAEKEPSSGPERKDLERKGLATTNWTQPAVLLHRNDEKQPWQRVALQRRIFPSQELLSLPGYRSELRLDTGIQLSLWGNMPEFWRTPVMESAVTLHANPDFDLDLTLQRGRVVFANRKENGPATIRLRFHGQSWNLTLLEPGTEAAAELFGEKRPYTRQPGGTVPYLLMGVFALKGEARLKVNLDDHLLHSPSLFEWDSAYGPAPEPRHLPRTPDWWTNKTLGRTPEAKAMQSALYALSQRLVVKDTVDVILAETLSDADPANHVLAVRCLAAMQDFAGLLDALTDEKHLDVRLDAVESLRHILALDAANDDRLATVLKRKNFSDAQAQIALQLLHGFTEQQWQNQATRLAVVEYLAHDKLAIRQMAHYLLVGLVPEGRKIAFDAAGAADQRQRGYEEWRKLVAQGRSK
jgi:hypothetical protein